MMRNKRRSDMHYLLLGVGSLMDLSGQSTRRIRHVPRRRRRRNTVETVAGYWNRVGRYLYQAMDSYSGPEANRR